MYFARFIKNFLRSYLPSLTKTTKIKNNSCRSQILLRFENDDESSPLSDWENAVCHFFAVGLETMMVILTKLCNFATFCHSAIRQIYCKSGPCRSEAPQAFVEQYVKKLISKKCLSIIQYLQYTDTRKWHHHRKWIYYVLLHEPVWHSLGLCQHERYRNRWK